MSAAVCDHGGGLDAALSEFGGARGDWIDLSTGINPRPYPLGTFSPGDWQQLPDQEAMDGLLDAARAFWNVPDGAGIIAAPGASALIARVPALTPGGKVAIAEKTYSEHAAAFHSAGWRRSDDGPDARVVVHPNNPDGALWARDDRHCSLTVVDESFCDTDPSQSLISLAGEPGFLVLKSFGKFWGLAGLRLGFAIGDPRLIARMRQLIGPWAVSGPALRLGKIALSDRKWAEATRTRLRAQSGRLDKLMADHGIENVGGTSLFRLYDTEDAPALFRGLATHHILTRIFPYSQRWMRLGHPAFEPDWARLTAALNAGS